MADSDLTEELGDPDEQREQLLEETEAEARQYEQEQAELLEAVKNEEEFSHGGTEWVELGDVDLKVRTEMPGDVVDTMTEVAETEQSGAMPDLSQVVDAAAKMTEQITKGDVSWSTQPRIEDFWGAYYAEHGSTVVTTAVERVLEPALENMDGQVPQSFRNERRR
jgi:hypothetical protein